MPNNISFMKYALKSVPGLTGGGVPHGVEYGHRITVMKSQCLYVHFSEATLCLKYVLCTYAALQSPIYDERQTQSAKVLAMGTFVQTIHVTWGRLNQIFPTKIYVVFATKMLCFHKVWLLWVSIGFQLKRFENSQAEKFENGLAHLRLALHPDDFKASGTPARGTQTMGRDISTLFG